MNTLVDGCNRVQAFWHVNMPVMWPGVITTGLFSFLLAYNDFTVTVSLLSIANHTMIPKLESFLGTVQIAGDRLAENWVSIDLLYFLKQQGLDVLDRTTQTGRR